MLFILTWSYECQKDQMQPHALISPNDAVTSHTYDEQGWKFS